MVKLSKPFEFILPLMRIVRGRRTAEHVGDLVISGIATDHGTLPDGEDRFTYNLLSIKWKDVEVIGLLEHLSDTTGYSMLHIYEAIQAHVGKLFLEQEESVNGFNDDLSALKESINDYESLNEYRNHPVGTL